MKLLISSLLLLGPATAITIDNVVVVNVMAGGSFRVMMMCTASEWYEVGDELDC